MWVDRHVPIKDVIARHGGQERVTFKCCADEHDRLYWLRRRPNSGTVQRAIAYLHDPDVYFAEVSSNQPLEPASGSSP